MAVPSAGLWVTQCAEDRRASGGRGIAVGARSYGQPMTGQRLTEREYAAPRVLVTYPRRTMADGQGDLTDQQKEWFSRSFLVGIAAAAKFPVELTLNDVNGVDATVHDGGISTDWQLKGTSSPDWSSDKKTLFFDLDVRTYNLFIGDRNSSGYLGVVVVPDDDAKWAAVSDNELLLRHCGYWQKITGLSATENTATVRIHLPIEQKLNVIQIRQIMSSERKRISA